METESKKTNMSGKKLRRTAATVFTALLVIAAALLFFYRDRLTSEGIREIFGVSRQVETDREAFTYESSSEQVFAMSGSSLAIASASGIEQLDSNGYTLVREIFSMTAPSVAVCPKFSVFYDIGATTLRVVASDGISTSLDTEQPIISVTVNSGGYIAVATEEIGYKGLVTVYNPSLSAVYKWYSGTGYLLSAAVSPDGASLAILCLTADGSVVHLTDLISEDVRASYMAENELLFDIHWFSKDKFCAISASRVAFFDGGAVESASYDFGGMYLTDYTTDTSGYMAVMLSKYRSGNAGTLTTLSSSGSVLASADFSKSLVSMSAYDDRFLILYSDSLVVYDRSLEEKFVYDDVLGLKTAFLRAKGDILLISQYSAMPYSYK